MVFWSIRSSVLTFYGICLWLFILNPCILCFSKSNKKSLNHFCFLLSSDNFRALCETAVVNFFNKNIVKDVIYWDQAKWFCSIHSDMRALSMQVVLYRFEQKTSELDFGKWQFFFKTLLFANGLSYYALLGLEWKSFWHSLLICFNCFNR